MDLLYRLAMRWWICRQGFSLGRLTCNGVARDRSFRPFLSRILVPVVSFGV